ncbi:MAG TPA: hypothetical protein VIH99_08290 [Bdellovibrionota bacterium]|jgi:hypothetical protein
MADRILNLNQQIALLPAAIPDSVLDFLEDFTTAAALQTEASRSAYDQEYLKNQGENLRTGLEGLRAEVGKLLQVQVDQAGREIPGGFLLKLSFERGVRGVGLLTKLKERSILRVLFLPGEYAEPALRDLLKNPPIQG